MDSRLATRVIENVLTRAVTTGKVEQGRPSTVMLEGRIAVIPEKNWERFDAWAAEPARKIPGLWELARRPPDIAKAAPRACYRKTPLFSARYQLQG